MLLHRLDPRAKLLATVCYLVALLSVPLTDPIGILLFAALPAAGASLCELGLRRMVSYSLIAVPLAAMIGIFNPLLERQTAFYVGPVAVSAGWAAFVGILLRGMLSVQAVLLLLFSTGFNGICSALRRLGLPALLVVQLQMVYRYLFVMLREASSMDAARRSRGFGRKHYPLSLWAKLVGQLLIRSVDRAERVHRAMLARGFSGDIVSLHQSRWRLADTVFLLVVLLLLALLLLITKL